MKAYTKSHEEILRELCSDISDGLTDSQADTNAEKYGANSLKREKPPSLLRQIIGAMREPMLIMLLLAAVIALGVNTVIAATGGSADFLECVGIFAAIGICVGITVGMEGKSAKAFEALARINEDTVVKVIRNGSAVHIYQQDIVAGDIVLISAGDRVPADGRVLSGSALEADESSLTGESRAVKKRDTVLTESAPLAERVNMLYSGCFITGGSGKMIVTEVGADTELGKISAELSATVQTNTPLQEKLAKMGKIIAVIGSAAAAIAFTAQVARFIGTDTATLENIAEAFITSIVLIVAAVPEGLPAIVAVSLALSVIKMSKQNALVKKMAACETIGCIDVICSDKTGTLTENRMTVVNDIACERILENIAVNSTAEVCSEMCGSTRIGNPTECALLAKVPDYRARRKNALAEITAVIPFSSEEKTMTTVMRNITYIKGSPEKIIALCNDDRFCEEILAYQKKACRIIGFAHATPDVDGQRFRMDGFAAITDPVRAEVFGAVSDCRSAGITLKMLTGDNIITATAIGEELGLLQPDGIATEACELEHLSDNELGEMLPRIRIIARSTPAVKMRVVKLLKAQGHVVAVTGDGINDAPAIKNADAGIAMGITGTEVSKEAADIVLLDDSFATITKAVMWGRGIYENFQRFIVFQLTVNLSSVLVVLVSIILGFWGLTAGAPFTALQLLWINLIMDGPPALALGLEPITEKGDLMKRAPAKRSAPILSRCMVARIVVISAFVVAVFMSQSLFNWLGAAEEHRATVLFSLFATFKLFNVLNCRELGRTSMFRRFGANKLVLSAVGIAFAAQILIVQLGGAFFRTVPLPVEMWARIIAVAATVIAVSELFRLGVGRGARESAV
jgi:Ca2+-transporting ATPase